MTLDYRQCVAEIESLGVMPERPPSLEPMRRALEAMGILERIDPRRVIVVAGTNGKGSVSATLAHLLQSAGKRAGLYTSPHLVETTERIRVNGEDLSPDRFAAAYRTLRPIALKLKLSHFEVLTGIAAWVFFSGEPEAPRPVEYAVLEVGLGGLWDATNAIPHTHCVVTQLGYDHQNLLGETLAEIARNKFGIVTPGASVVHAPLPPDAAGAAREVQASTASNWLEAPPWPLEPSPRAGRGPRFIARTPWGPRELSLAGPRGAANAAVAVCAFQALGFDPSAHLSALASVRWPGRMEPVRIKEAPCPVYLSGDHNVQGVQSLLELLPAYPRRQLHLLVGIGKDKQLDEIMERFASLPDTRIHLTETPFRGRTLSSYGPWLERAASHHADPSQALKQVFGHASSEDMILVTGSLYLVGAIRAMAEGA